MNATPAKSIHGQLQADFRLQVKVLLLQKNSSVTKLAEILGVTRQSLSVAINHPSMLPGLKERIRKELEMSS